jgi:hypothetical protein
MVRGQCVVVFVVVVCMSIGDVSGVGVVVASIGVVGRMKPTERFSG